MKELISLLLFFPFLVHAQLLEKKETPKVEGHYWDLNGNKQIGLFEIDHTKSAGVGTKIKFYADGSDKPEKLNKKHMTSFVMGSDSFALIHNFRVTPIIKYISDFAEVVDTGAIHLYLHKRKAQQSGSTGMNSGFGTAYYSIYLEDYIIRKNNSQEYICISSKKTLEDVFLPMIEDYTELHKSVSLMKPKDAIEQLPALVREYNKYKKANP